jgi:uncharacterized membrane protein YhhN
VPGVALAVVAVAVCLAGHLWADAAGRAVPRAALKAGASAGFLAVAGLSTAGGRYGGLIAAGLVLSAGGDLLLLARARSAFLAGLGAFLLAHLAYAAAFAPAARVSVAVAAGLALAGAGVVRWLWPRLGGMRGPVVAYAAAITLMLVLALGVASPLARAGAALFYLSDLTVARDRFVRPGLANRVVGLPLYYAGQLLLALSTRDAR